MPFIYYYLIRIQNRQNPSTELIVFNLCVFTVYNKDCMCPGNCTLVYQMMEERDLVKSHVLHP